MSSDDQGVEFRAEVSDLFSVYLVVNVEDAEMRDRPSGSGANDLAFPSAPDHAASSVSFALLSVPSALRLNVTVASTSCSSRFTFTIGAGCAGTFTMTSTGSPGAAPSSP